MKSFPLLKFNIWIATLSLGCQFASPQDKMHYPTPVIFDTDFGPDYDDVGAITLLHAFADSGNIKILATGASNRYSNICAALSVFNTYFNRSQIPIGIVKGRAVELGNPQHWSDSVIAKYPHPVRSNDQVPDAVSVYRQQLAKQPDHSVVIITVGFLTNMAHLLKSSPDAFSPLPGKDLVRKKVKELVSMGGSFPNGTEFNISRDERSSEYTYDNWPTPVVFTGFQIGMKIHCGLPLIHNQAIRNDPVKDVFRISIPLAREDSLGRMSWDETAVLIAVKGWKPFYNAVKGRIVVLPDGSNSWDTSGKGEMYITEKVPPQVVQALINQLLLHQPLNKKPG